jgi:uncharacterized tellurite resistance protein B-like protein
MINWPRFVKKLMLAEGRINEVEAELLERTVDHEGCIEMEEVAFLVALKREAVWVHPRYDRFLLDVLKKVVLKDGRISDNEAGFLRKLILADHQVTAAEKAFLLELKQEAQSYGPKFILLYEQCTKFCNDDYAG